MKWFGRFALFALLAGEAAALAEDQAETVAVGSRRVANAQPLFAAASLDTATLTAMLDHRLELQAETPPATLTTPEDDPRLIGVVLGVNPPKPGQTTTSRTLGAAAGDFLLLRIHVPEAKSLRAQVSPLLAGAAFTVTALASPTSAEVVDERVVTANDGPVWTASSEGTLWLLIHSAQPFAYGPDVQVLAVAAELEALAADMSCIPDATCRVSSGPLEDAKHAVAQIRYIKGGGLYLCSGTLLNDMDPLSQGNYFLTANHCIGSQSVADTLEFWWGWRSTSCNGSTPANSQKKSSGAQLLATSGDGDWAFLKVPAKGLPSPFIQYAGWAVGSLSLGTEVHGLHHPSGSLLRYSHGYNARRYFTSGPPQFKTVTWDDGDTAPGSSGSGLFHVFSNSAHVVGTLRGGAPSCGSPRVSVYGAFDYFYPHIRRWLEYRTPPKPDDHGDVWSAATSLPLDADGLHGVINDPPSIGTKDYDWFTLTVPRRGILEVFTAGKTDLWADLRNSNGASPPPYPPPFQPYSVVDRSSGAGSNPHFRVYCYQAGTAYLALSGYTDRDRGGYLVYARFSDVPADDHADQHADATAVSATTRVPVNLDTHTWTPTGGGNFDRDWFRIETLSSGTLTVATEGHGKPGVAVWVYNGTPDPADYAKNRIATLTPSIATGNITYDQLALSPAVHYLVFPGEQGTPARQSTLVLQYTGQFRPFDADTDKDLAIGTDDLLPVVRGLHTTNGFDLSLDCDRDGELSGDDALCVAREIPGTTPLADRTALLDLDGDGRVDPLTDGVLLVRLAQGLDGAALVRKAIGPKAKRTDAAAIRQYLRALAPAFDIDGDGAFAVADGWALVEFTTRQIGQPRFGAGTATAPSASELYLLQLLGDAIEAKGR